MISARRHARYWRACFAGGGMVVICATTLLASPLQPLAPGSGKPASSPPQPLPDNPAPAPGTNKAITQAPAILVKLLNTGKSDAESTEEAKNEKKHAANERMLICLTGVLALAAFFQLGALFWQTILLRRTVKAADRALTDLERPYVFVEVREGIFINEEPMTDENYAFRFAIFNFGRVPAEVIRASVRICQAGHTPTEGDQRGDLYGGIGAGSEGKVILFRIPVGTKMDGNMQSDGAAKLRGAWPGPVLRPTKSPDYNTFFYVVLRYRGIGKAVYDTNACWRWDHTADRWVVLDDTRYNRRT